MIRKELAWASLAILMLLAAEGSAILDGGLGLSADQLIDQSRGVYSPPSGMPESPQESRELWSQGGEADFAQIGKRSENHSSVGLNESLAPIRSSSQIEVRPASSSPVTSNEADLEGNWSMRLSDSKNRFMALRLYVSEDAVFGAGTVNDGIETQRISASGFFAGRNVSLDAVASGGIILYRFDLAKDAASLSGQYRAFSAEGEPWSGIAQGKRVD